MEDMNNIRNGIKELAKSKGIGLFKIASLIGFTTSGLSQTLINGTLKVSDLIKISNVFEISPCELFSKVMDCDNYVIEAKTESLKMHYSNDALVVIGKLSIENHELKRTVELLKNKIYSLTNN